MGTLLIFIISKIYPIKGRMPSKLSYLAFYYEKVIKKINDFVLSCLELICIL